MASGLLSLLKRNGSRPRTGWIGIDVGSHSVKIAQLESAGGQQQIAEATVIPLPESGHRILEAVQSGWLARSLKEELSQHHGFRGTNVACGLSMNITDFRSMNIPPGTNRERREMISQELSDSGDMLASTVEFDYWDSYRDSATSGAADLPVNVLSVSAELATQVAEAIQGAGLHCQVLDGGPFAMARAVALMNGPATHPVAILDWGHHAAHIAVVINGQPVFSRLMKDCGVGSLVATVGRELGLSPDESHQLLRTCGLPEPQRERAERTELQELVEDYASERLSQLLAELNKTLSYLTMQRPELVPEELFLVGGGATIRNMEAKLCFEMGMPVRSWQFRQRPSARIGLDSHPVELFGQAAALSELGWGL